MKRVQSEAQLRLNCKFGKAKTRRDPDQTAYPLHEIFAIQAKLSFDCTLFMSKTLIIAEKPSVAIDLARVLGVKKSGDHHENDRYVISSAVGHVVECSTRGRGSETRKVEARESASVAGPL